MRLTGESDWAMPSPAEAMRMLASLATCVCEKLHESEAGGVLPEYDVWDPAWSVEAGARYAGGSMSMPSLTITSPLSNSDCSCNIKGIELQLSDAHGNPDESGACVSISIDTEDAIPSARREAGGRVPEWEAVWALRDECEASSAAWLGSGNGCEALAKRLADLAVLCATSTCAACRRIGAGELCDVPLPAASDRERAFGCLVDALADSFGDNDALLPDEVPERFEALGGNGWVFEPRREGLDGDAAFAVDAVAPEFRPAYQPLDRVKVAVGRDMSVTASCAFDWGAPSSPSRPQRESLGIHIPLTCWSAATIADMVADFAARCVSIAADGQAELNLSAR